MYNEKSIKKKHDALVFDLVNICVNNLDKLIVGWKWHKRMLFSKQYKGEELEAMCYWVIFTWAGWQ